MSLEIEVLEYLNEKKPGFKYKGLRVNLLGLPDFQYYRYQTLANRFSILHKKGFIKKMPNGECLITFKGKIFLKKQKNVLKKFHIKITFKNYIKNNIKNIIEQFH